MTSDPAYNVLSHNIFNYPGKRVALAKLQYPANAMRSSKGERMQDAGLAHDEDRNNHPSADAG